MFFNLDPLPSIISQPFCYFNDSKGERKLASRMARLEECAVMLGSRDSKA